MPAAPASLASVLPISTPELTPGSVEARRLGLPWMQPIFLLGNDPLSRRWLDERKESLRQLRAVGLVVNIEDEAAFGELQTLAGDIELLPVSGSDLASGWGCNTTRYSSAKRELNNEANDTPSIREATG